MKRMITAALAVTGLLAFPAAGQAAQNFGSQLKNGPANGPMECTQPGSCTFVGYRHPTPPNGDNVPSPAPFDGVVVKLRARSATPDPVQFAFANITEQGTGNNKSAIASMGAIGPSVTFAGTEAVEEFPARVSVKKGMQVALNAPKHGATYDSNGGEDSYIFAPQLQLGQGPRGSSADSGGELLVQAQIEADTDRDGFGDETQDRCKNQSGAAGGCDRVKPRLRGLSAKKTRIGYRLSERARVTLKIQKRANGRYRGVRTLKVRGKSGRNALRTSKRLRRALKTGRYRVVAVAQGRGRQQVGQEGRPVPRALSSRNRPEGRDRPAPAGRSSFCTPSS